VRNLTDIMTIPTSVARRAFQGGLAGGNATFFYVRRFVENGTETFVRVTCRMGGGGARVPLAIIGADLGFMNTDRSVYYFLDTEPLPRFGANIKYNGSGRLKGRWEVVIPGDPEPTDFDLLPEASLPIEQRGLQQRYTLISRFDVFLPPTGRTFIRGPDPKKVPTNANGPYKILMRVEATDDREGNSNTLAGVVSSGGVSGFSIPPLLYYLRGKGDARIAPGAGAGNLVLLGPSPDARISTSDSPDFSWTGVPGANLYKLEVRDESQAKYSAFVQAGTSNYTLPPWLRDESGSDTPLFWRVVALSNTGGKLVSSDWRQFRFSE